MFWSKKLQPYDHEGTKLPPVKIQPEPSRGAPARVKRKRREKVMNPESKDFIEIQRNRELWKGRGFKFIPRSHPI